MKSKKKWHKLKNASGETGRETKPASSPKPPAHTDSLRGSRQGNAGMEEDTDGAHR